MAKRIAHKLRDQSGASLSAALLLFLICTVLSAVVLAAGTAAAGRVSELSSMDRRYYNVTSAARVFKRVFDDKAIEITRTETKQEVDGNPSGEEGYPKYSFSIKYEDIIYSFSINRNGTFDSPEHIANYNNFRDLKDKRLLVNLASDIVFGTDVSDEISASWFDHVAIPVKLASNNYTPPSLSVEGDEDGDLAIDSRFVVDTTTGDVALTISNRAGTEKYEFPMYFTLSLNEDIPAPQHDYSYSSSVDADGNVTTHVIDTITTTKTATLSWHATEFGEVSAP